MHDRASYMARIKPEFDRRNVKIIGLSVDPVDNHALVERHRWNSGHGAELPDDRRHRPEHLEELTDAAGGASKDLRRPHRRGQPDGSQRVRGRPDKKIKLILIYPMTTGATSTKSCASSTRSS